MRQKRVLLQNDVWNVSENWTKRTTQIGPICFIILYSTDAQPRYTSAHPQYIL